MKTIYPVPATDPYIPKYGDLICNFDGTNIGEVLENVRKDDFANKQVLPLATINPNPFDSLTILHIDFRSVLAPYFCPYTKCNFYSIVPAALISDDLEGKYGSIEFWNKEYIFDYGWHKKMFGDGIFKLGEIGNLLLGSGYTNCASFNDGNSSRNKTTVGLDNGDKILVYFLEWHNK